MTKKKRFISIFTRPMAPKRSRMVTGDEEITPTKSRDTSITWSRENQKKVISPLSQGLWTPNVKGWWLRIRKHKVTWHFDQVVTGQMKSIVSPFFQDLQIPSLAKWQLRMRTPHPQSHSTIQSVVMWQIKYVISPLSQGLSPPNLARWSPKIKATPAKSCNTSTTWSRDK